MIRKIVLAGKAVEYDLQRKSVKNINLRIKADQSVFVSANDNVPLNTIEVFLQSKAEYIVSTLGKYAEQAKFVPGAKEYVDGESFAFLGRELRLKIEHGTKNFVDINGAYLVLTVKPDADFAQKEKVVNHWLNTQCRETVAAVCESVFPKFEKYGVTFPQTRLRTMVSRWGSCQPKRKILTFNTALIEAPLSCIEYVVVHEFTHFLHPNHSRAFYNTLAMFMPDWKERKNELEKSRFFVE